MNNENVRYRKRYFRIIPMTTIIGVKCENGIVIGSDSQLTIESINPTKQLDFNKIYRIGNMLIACAGDTEYFEKLKNEIYKRIKLKFKNIQELIDIVEASVKYIHDNYPNQNDCISEIIFGISIECELYLYRIYSYHCYALEINNFYTTGSGGVFAEYILRRVWDDNLKTTDAFCILSYVINETTKIDQYSNSPIKLVMIRKNGNIYPISKKDIEKLIVELSGIDEIMAKLLRESMLDTGLLKITKNKIILEFNKIKNGRQKEI